jgi:di/tricarboxylate transporter
MTGDIILVLAIVAVAVVLFATEKLRVDIIALLVLLTLTLTGLLTYQEAFSGFASPAVITVWAVYIVSGGIAKTGAASLVSQRIVRAAGSSEPRMIAIIMLTCGVLSAFMNNIGATAMLLPAVVGISRTTKIPLSRLLIPLSFSSLLGGNMTLIGTPPNVLASTILQDRGLQSFQFFDFTPIGVIVLLTGVIFMALIGRHLLPHRSTSEEQQTARLREYVSEVRVLPGSPLTGQTLVESRLGADYDLTVISILRSGSIQVGLSPDTQMLANDLMLVEASVDNLIRARDQLKLAIEAERNPELAVHEPDRSNIVEATLAPRSRIIGRTLRELFFRERYGLTVLAVGRHGEIITSRLREVKLQFGDTLLLQGPRHRINYLQERDDFLVLEPARIETNRQKKMPFALGSLLLVLLLVTVLNFHVSTAMVIGALMMVLTGCLTMDEAYQSIEWRSVFLIAGMLPLGLAMESTGTARFLADHMIFLLRDYGPIAILAGIYILAGLITEPMSNAAATVLVVPISIDIALELGANPQIFVLATVIGASTSFLTPVGHQANVLVFGPGGYRFLDYTKVGFLLNVVLFIVVMIFLPILWPLF